MGQGTNSESPQAPQARWNQQATGNLSGEPTYDNARDRARECHSEKTTAVSFYGTGHKKVKTFHTGRRRLNLTRPTRFNQLLLLSVPEQGERGAILGDTATATTIAYLLPAYCTYYRSKWPNAIQSFREGRDGDHKGAEHSGVERRGGR